jgi:hypothetical protein
MDIKDIAVGMYITALKDSAYITAGKEYEVIKIDGDDVRIKADGGEGWWARPDIFEPAKFTSGWESI